MSLLALPADLHWLLCREHLREQEHVLLRRTCRTLRDRIEAPPWSLHTYAADEPFAPLSVMVLYALEHDSPTLLQWLQSGPRAQWTLHDQCHCDEHLCAHAAAHGSLRAISFLLACGYAWSAQAEDAAAQHGHVEVLRWRLCTHGLLCSRDVVCVAARHHQYAVLRLAVEEQGLASLCADDWAQVRDRDTIDWMHAYYKKHRADAVQTGSVHRDQHHMLHCIAVGLCCAAAASGYQVLLNALLDANAALDDEDDQGRIYAAAAGGGQLDVLAHLQRRYRLPRDTVLEAAARAGQVHVMQWIMTQKHTYSVFLCCDAIKARQFDAAVYAMRAYCKPNTVSFSHSILGSVLWQLAADVRCSDAVLEEVLERAPPLDSTSVRMLLLEAPLPRLEQLCRRYPRAPWCTDRCVPHLQLERERLLAPCYTEYTPVSDAQRRAQRAAVDARLACLERLTCTCRA